MASRDIFMITKTLCCRYSLEGPIYMHPDGKWGHFSDNGNGVLVGIYPGNASRWSGDTSMKMGTLCCNYMMIMPPEDVGSF